MKIVKHCPRDTQIPLRSPWRDSRERKHIDHHSRDNRDNDQESDCWS